MQKTDYEIQNRVASRPVVIDGAVTEEVAITPGAVDALLRAHHLERERLAQDRLPRWYHSRHQ